MSEPTPAESLKLARDHLDRAQTAAIEPVDWTDLATYGFYCLEAAVMAAGTHVGLEVVRSHQGKADGARQLARRFKLPDVSELLGDLNAARKAYCYGGVEAPEMDPEDLATELEEFVEAVGELLEKKRGKKRR